MPSAIESLSKNAPLSTLVKLIQVVCTIVWALFAAGPMFGFAALKPFLISENVYENLCYSSSGSHTDILFSITDKPVQPVCADQDLKLNLIFTVCAVLTNICALPVGYLLDNYGPKFCGLCGASIIFLGSLLIVNSANIVMFDPYLFGFGLVALGGPFTFISSFHLSNAFPQYSGTILAFLTGAFDSSSSVFVLYSMLNSHLSSDSYYFSISEFFKIYLIVPIFIVVVQIVLMPTRSYKSPSPAELASEPNEHQPLLTNVERRSSLSEMTHMPITVDEEVHEAIVSGGIFGILHGKSLKEQFKSPWFTLLTLFASIQMLRLNYFISTINSQYTYLFGSHNEATQLNAIFDIMLPMGGLVSIPIVGYFLDNYSTLIVTATLVGISLAIGVFGFIPNNFFAGVINVILFVVYRPFFYSTLSDICAKVFGFETFGILYGSIMSISGVLNFAQSNLDALTHTIFKMNPGPINYMLVAATALICVTTVVFIKYEADNYGTNKKLASAIDEE